MKRTIIWVAILALLLGLLTGCGKQEAAAEAEQVDPAPDTSAQQAPKEPVHIHDFDVAVTEMTCTQDGITIYTCACGAVYEGAAKPAPGHDYQEEIFEATIAADGFTRYTCANCGDVYEDNPVPMLPDGIEDGSFFDDAVFIGDSITLSMTTYENLYDCFGDALILCRPSFSIRSAANHQMSLAYRGGSYTVAEALAARGAKKVFIQLGMNDIATLTADRSIEFWGTVVGEIREACPDILIFIQSGTPIYDERGELNNANMDSYNEDLKAFAEENGCFFVDIATPLKDENGFLKKEYCNDEYCHLSLEGCEVWEKTLKAYLLEHKGEFA